MTLARQALLSGLTVDKLFPARPKVSVPIPAGLAKKLTISGVIKDAKGVSKWDPNPDLTQYKLRGLKHDHGEYHRMYVYDGTVKGVNKLVQCEVVRADWQFEYRPDESEDERMVRTSCEAMLGLGDNRASFPGGLRGLIKTAAMSTRYGFSPHEVCWDYKELMEIDRPDEEMSDEDRQKEADEATKAKTPPPPPEVDGEGNVKPAKPEPVEPVEPIPKPEVQIRMEERLCPVEIKWVAPWSVDGWIVDKTDTIKSLVQIQVATSNEQMQKAIKDGISKIGSSVTTEKEVIVPIDKMLIFNHDAAPGHIEGAGMCRSGWAFYRAKMDTLLRDQASLDKLSDGLFIVQEQGDKDGAWKVVSATDQQEMGYALSAVRSGRTNRLWVPFGLEVLPEWPAGNNGSNLENYRYYDHMILVSALAAVLGLGQTAAGKGLSDGLMIILYHMIEEIADDIASVINGDGNPWTGLIEKYVAYNFPDFVGRLPKLIPGQIAFQDVASFVETITKGQQFLSLTQDARDENDLRRKLRMSRRAFKELKASRDKAAAKSGQSTQGGQAPPSQTEKGNERNMSKKKGGDGSDNEKK